MGSTSVCPGTYVCEGSMKRICDQHSFQVKTNETHWRTGDAIIYNMNSWHRGAAHIDPNEGDRVVMIFTLTSKPRPRGESRRVSDGIPYSQRWEYFGFTWRDFQVGRERWFPWIRALGLWKSSGANWGYDYITLFKMKIANSELNDKKLGQHIKSGGFRFLPKFLQVNNFYEIQDLSMKSKRKAEAKLLKKRKKNDDNDNDDSDGGSDDSDDEDDDDSDDEEDLDEDDEENRWHDYCLQTLHKCEEFAYQAYPAALAFYIVLYFVLNLFSGSFKGIGRATRRLVVFHLVLWGIYGLILRHVDNTNWARDILAGNLYTDISIGQEPIYSADSPTTLPNRDDVLIETRYGSRELYFYNGFINNHPGNALLNKQIQKLKDQYEDYPPFLQNATINHVVNLVHSSQGRFLHQSANATWRIMLGNETHDYMERIFSLESRPLLAAIVQEVRFQRSEHKYGIHRLTALAKKHTVPYLEEWGMKLVPLQQRRRALAAESTKAKSKITFTAGFPGRSRLQEVSASQLQHHAQEKGPLLIPNEPTLEPRQCGFCKSGDLALLKQYSYPRKVMIPATIVNVTAHDMFYIKFLDGRGVAWYPRVALFPYSDIPIGEKVELLQNGAPLGATVIGTAGQEEASEEEDEHAGENPKYHLPLYNLKLEETEEIVKGVATEQIRRFLPESWDKKWT